LLSFTNHRQVAHGAMTGWGPGFGLLSLVFPVEVILHDHQNDERSESRERSELPGDNKGSSYPQSK
jgi:hypothetical protein